MTNRLMRYQTRSPRPGTRTPRSPATVPSLTPSPSGTGQSGPNGDRSPKAQATARGPTRGPEGDRSPKAESVTRGPSEAIWGPMRRPGTLRGPTPSSATGTAPKPLVRRVRRRLPRFVVGTGTARAPARGPSVVGTGTSFAPERGPRVRGTGTAEPPAWGPGASSRGPRRAEAQGEGRAKGTGSVDEPTRGKSSAPCPGAPGTRRQRDRHPDPTARDPPARGPQGRPERPPGGRPARTAHRDRQLTSDNHAR